MNKKIRRMLKSVENGLSKIGGDVCRAIKQKPLEFFCCCMIAFATCHSINMFEYMKNGNFEEKSTTENGRMAVMIAETDTSEMEKYSTEASNEPKMTTKVTTTSGTTETMVSTTEISVETTAAETCTTTECATTTRIQVEEVTESATESNDFEADSSLRVEDENECYGVGQFGRAIQYEEYDALAQVIEHEGADCEVGVKERIGICLLNRTFREGFCDTVYENKEAAGQYFYGYYAYSDESRIIAQYLIEAYNSGAEYWEQFCNERGLTGDTIYQRNDYAVPGTEEVFRETASTSGGYVFTLVYSR